MAYDASDSLTAVSTGIEGIASLGTAWEQSQALKSQGEFQLNMARINSQFADIQAKQVIDQGNYEAHQIQRKGNRTAGSQRAAAAAQGIDVNDSQGSAAELVDDTKLATADDISQARSNAWMTAWGIKTQSVLNIDSAESKKSGADFAANQTLLTGGLKAAGAFAKVGGIYAKSGQKQTSDPSASSSGLSPGQLLDRSIYEPPKTLNGSNFYTGGWWQKPAGDDL